MRLTAKEIDKLKGSGATVKRKPRPKSEKNEKVVMVPPAQVKVETPPAAPIPDYGPELRELISVLGNKPERPRGAWRVVVNRGRFGPESYDIFPIERE